MGILSTNTQSLLLKLIHQNVKRSQLKEILRTFLQMSPPCWTNCKNKRVYLEKFFYYCILALFILNDANISFCLPNSRNNDSNESNIFSTISKITTASINKDKM